MKVRAVSAVVAFALLSCNCFAVRLDMKPGLWEHSFKMSGGSLAGLQPEQQQQMQEAVVEMKKRFADMPPEQRKQMEAMMKQNGIEIDPAVLLAGSEKILLAKEGAVVKECVTQDQIDKDELPTPGTNCKSTVVQKSSNTFKVNYKCTGDFQANGTSEVTFQSPKAYTGTTSYSMGSSSGGAASNQLLEGTVSGKWLSSDCRTIEPKVDSDAAAQEL